MLASVSMHDYTAALDMNGWLVLPPLNCPVLFGDGGLSLLVTLMQLETQLGYV